jgi:hypothetical protein
MYITPSDKTQGDVFSEITEEFMNAQTESQIAVFFCKHFPAVVNKVRSNEPTTVDTGHAIVSGLLHQMEGIFSVALSRQEMGFIDSMVANGYCVTGYLRQSDFTLFIPPFSDETEMVVAKRVNERIWAEVFPDDLPS